MDKLIGRGTRSGRVFAAVNGIALAIGLVAGGCGSSSNGGGSGGGGGSATGSGGRDGGTAGSAGQPDAGADTVGTGSDVAVSTLDFPFLADADGFALDTFSTPGPYTNGNPQNLGGALDAAVAPTAAFDGSVGMPAPGSLAITAMFSDFNQTVNVRRLYAATATISLAGKILTAQVRLDPGSTFTGSVHLVALSTPSPPAAAPGYYFAQGNSSLLTDNNWHTLTFDLSVPEFAAAGFDPTNIVQVGVQLASGDSAAAVATGDGAASGYGAPQPLSIHFDSVTSN